MFILQVIILIAVAVTVWWQKSGRFLTSYPGNDDYLQAETNNKRGRTTRLYLGVRRGVPVPMIIRPQRWYDNLLLSLDLSHEVKLHHALDEKLFMMCDHASAFTHLARKTEIGPMMIALYNKYKIKKLFLLKDRIYAKVDPDSTDRAAFCRDLMQISAAIGKLEKHPMVGRVANSRLSLMKLAIFMMSLHIILLMYGVCGGIALIADSRSTLASNLTYLMGAAFFPVLAGWFYTVVMLFWRTSWIGIVLADFVLVGIAGILLSGTIVVREMNIELDKNSPELVRTKVTTMDCEFTCTSGTGKRRRSSHYDYAWSSCSTEAKRQAVMSDLRKQYYRCANQVYVSELNISVGPVSTLGKKIADSHKWNAEESIFDRSAPGATMVMPIMPGHLQIPWVDDTAIYPEK